MDNVSEQLETEVIPNIERKHYVDPIIQAVFQTWLRINDSIETRFIPRSQWNQVDDKSIFSELESGKKILLVPQDLQLWEMAGLMKTIDQNTFGPNSPKTYENQVKIQNLGHLFHNGGIYIAKRLDSVDQGKQHAKALAQIFYTYGLSLISGQKETQDVDISTISKQNLTESDEGQVDWWLATGRPVVESELKIVNRRLRKDETLSPDEADVAEAILKQIPRHNIFIKALENGSDIEATRSRKLKQFFGIVEKLYSSPNPNMSDRSVAKQFQNWWKSKIIRSDIFDDQMQHKYAAEILKNQTWEEYQNILNSGITSETAADRKKVLEDVIFSIKPWISKRPYRERLTADLKQKIERSVTTPETDMFSSIVRRGLEYLRVNMKFDRLQKTLEIIKDKTVNKKTLTDDELRISKLEPLIIALFSWQKCEETLRSALGIDSMKLELEKARQAGNGDLIESLELKFAEKVQSAVSTFPRVSNISSPSEIVRNQELNCVGASLLGSSLLTELKISHMIGDVPKHSIVVLVTGTDKVVWFDMLNPEDNEELTDNMIAGVGKNGQKITRAGIVNYSRHPLQNSLQLEIISPGYRDKVHWISAGQYQYLTLYPAEIGAQVHLLDKIGFRIKRYLPPAKVNEMDDLDYLKMELDTYQRLLVLDPDSFLALHGAGDKSLRLAIEESDHVMKQVYLNQALDHLIHAIDIAPQISRPYFDLGSVFDELIYESKYSKVKNSLTFQYMASAQEVWRKFLLLADKQDVELIQFAQDRINELTAEFKSLSDT